MQLRSLSALLLSALAIIAVDLAAAPIDFTFGIASGVLYVPFHQGETLRDGLEITTPFPDYVQNKSYSAQIVGPGSNERNEAFVALAGDRNRGFGSALTGADGTMEVGVFNEIRDRSYWAAISRSYMTIKNNTDEEIDFDFFYEIEAGELAVRGIRSDHTARARIEATIDYVLLTPNGGTYDETTGNLLHYFAGIEFDNFLTHSSNAIVTLKQRDTFNLVYGTEKLKGNFPLPTIPAYGQLTYYYDLFSTLNVQRFEIGGHARIGDPTDLVGGGSFRLVQASDAAVPEPSTMLLVSAGFIAALARHRKRNA